MSFNVSNCIFPLDVHVCYASSFSNSAQVQRIWLIQEKESNFTVFSIDKHRHKHLQRFYVYTPTAVTARAIQVTTGITVSQLRDVWSLGVMFSWNQFNFQKEEEGGTARALRGRCQPLREPAVPARCAVPGAGQRGDPRAAAPLARRCPALPSWAHKAFSLMFKCSSRLHSSCSLSLVPLFHWLRAVLVLTWPCSTTHLLSFILTASNSPKTSALIKITTDLEYVDIMNTLSCSNAISLWKIQETDSQKKNLGSPKKVVTFPVLSLCCILSWSKYVQVCINSLHKKTESSSHKNQTRCRQLGVCISHNQIYVQ